MHENLDATFTDIISHYCRLCSYACIINIFYFITLHLTDITKYQNAAYITLVSSKRPSLEVGAEQALTGSLILSHFNSTHYQMCSWWVQTQATSIIHYTVWVVSLHKTISQQTQTSFSSLSQCEPPTASPKQHLHHSSPVLSVAHKVADDTYAALWQDPGFAAAGLSGSVDRGYNPVCIDTPRPWQTGPDRSLWGHGFHDCVPGTEGRQIC